MKGIPGSRDSAVAVFHVFLSLLEAKKKAVCVLLYLIFLESSIPVTFQSA